MIELVSEARCIKCDVCIRVCPTNVFAHGEDRLPVIARQADCQTCFMCEAWCPVDALFVAPEATPAPEGSRYRDESWLVEHELLGSYRREIGWGTGREALDADGRSLPDPGTGVTPPGADALGLDERRAAEPSRPRYHVGLHIAYSEEGEDVEPEPPLNPGRP